MQRRRRAWYGRSGLQSFNDPAIANAQVQSLVQRVYLCEESSFAARYPQEQPVTVRIMVKNSAVFDGSCSITKGEPSNPHTTEELAAKFLELGEPVWGKPTTQTLYHQLMQLENIADFRVLAGAMVL